MKKIIFGIAIFFLFILNVSAIDINSKHAIMYNMNDDNVVFEKNGYTKTPIASLTKIMTCIVSIENIDNIDDEVVITKEMLDGLVRDNLYVAGLKVNQKVTYRDLLYVTFLPSGADGASSLAYLVGTTMDNFVALMNKKASDLGLTNTHFANPTGLDNDDNYSTTDEVAKLLKYALSNDTFNEIFKTNSYTLSDGSLTVKSSIRNTASLFKYNIDYIIGAKTGLTEKAGRCLASLAYDSDNKIYYLLVTTQGDDNSKIPNHLFDAITIYNYYFDNYKYYNLVNKDNIVKSLPVKYSKITNVDLKVNDDIPYYYNNTFDKDKVTLTYEGIDSLTPDNKVGDKVGTLHINYDGKEVNSVDLILNESLPYSLSGFIIMNKYLIVIMLMLLILIDLNLLKLRIRKSRHKKRK